MLHKPLLTHFQKRQGVKTDVLNPLESLTEEDTKAGENYISVMEKNLKALKQTTDQEGPAIEPEKAEDTKTVQNGYFEDADVKDRTLSDYSQVTGNQFILSLKMEPLTKSLTTRLS